MKIDIESDRKILEACATVDASVALGYLDELELAREGFAGLKVVHEQLKEDAAKLRAQLSDQRAQAIRMIAIERFGLPADEEALELTAKAYDRLAAIPVPPASEKAGEP